MSGGNRPNKRASDSQGTGGKAVGESREARSHRVMDEWVDAYFDRSLTEGSRELLMSSIQQDPGRCEQVARMQRMISMLRQPLGESGQPAMRDQTGDILARLEKGRGFVTARGRRRVRQGRLAVAGGVLTACLALGLVWRAWPGLSLVPKPTPMSAVVSESSQAATQTLTRINDAVRSLGPATDGGIGLAQGHAQGRAQGVAYVLIPVAIAPLESIGPFDPLIEAGGDGSWGLPTGSGAIALTAPGGNAAWSDSTTARATVPMGELARRNGLALQGLVDGPTPLGVGEGEVCLAWPGASPRRVLVNVQRDGVPQGAAARGAGAGGPESPASKR